MSCRSVSYLAVALLIAGCADSDGDGLSDSKEHQLGTDAESPDSDDDGISDGDEVAAGLDPLIADMDGDTYGDGDELIEGTDPLDPESRIYQGYWPYNRDKDATPEVGLDTPLAVGQRFARVKMRDQFGEKVDLYDFLDEGSLVVIDLSAEWCSPCNDLAAWLEGDLPSFDDDWPGVRKAVKQGDIRWVTFLDQNNQMQSASSETCGDWYDHYPHDRIPVLADKNQELFEYLGASGWPTLRILESDLTLAEQSSGVYWDVLDTLVDRL